MWLRTRTLWKSHNSNFKQVSCMYFGKSILVQVLQICWINLMVYWVRHGILIFRKRPGNLRGRYGKFLARRNFFNSNSFIILCCSSFMQCSLSNFSLINESQSWRAKLEGLQNSTWPLLSLLNLIQNVYYQKLLLIWWYGSCYL